MRTRLSRLAAFFALGTLLVVSSTTIAAPADDPIQTAIKKGARYLQRVHAPNQAYAGGSNGVGGAALAGMALLESGVPENDASLRIITKYLRDSALAQTGTYQISLTIMFLDRLGDRSDQPIIQFLGLRLMTGQGANGGWGYDCGNAFSPQDEAKLRAMFVKETRLTLAPRNPVKGDPTKKEPPVEVGRTDLPVDPLAQSPMKDPKTPSTKKEPAPVAPKSDDVPTLHPLHPEAARWAKLLNLDKEGKGIGKGPSDGDNSNTQFATLGLWCARKHGVPCEKSLALLETRYRTSQGAEGGWDYSYIRSGGGSTPAMTCAGLIALAVAHGSSEHVLKNKQDNPFANKPNGGPDVGDDAAIKKALKYLGSQITAAKGEVPVDAANPKKKRNRFKADRLNSNLYFMWSLERVGVIYGLETIGNHDWYAWGSDSLIDSQKADGSFNGSFDHGENEEINTSFALLFLNRANVARDLSASLKGKVKDPGVSVLRGGGEIGKVLPGRESPKTDPIKSVAKIDPIPDPIVKKQPIPTVTGSDFETDVKRLTTALIEASAETRPLLLGQLRDSKGAVYTEALARAASKMSGEPQQEARQTLAKRLTRMTATTLREMLTDDSREIRRGAAVACAMKEDKLHIPDLISTLGDTDSVVVAAVRTSLHSLSGKDFGPAADASAGDKAKAILAWKNWWKTQVK